MNLNEEKHLGYLLISCCPSLLKGRLWGINLLCCCSLLWYQHGRNTNRQILKPWTGKSSFPLTIWLDYYTATIWVGALWGTGCDAEEVTPRYCHPICDRLALGSWQNKMMIFLALCSLPVWLGISSLSAVCLCLKDKLLGHRLSLTG